MTSDRRTSGHPSWQHVEAELLAPLGRLDDALGQGNLAQDLVGVGDLDGPAALDVGLRPGLLPD